MAVGAVFRTLHVGWHGMVIPTWSRDTPVPSSADKVQAFSLTLSHTYRHLFFQQKSSVF